jgi:alkylhydroperoxidase/carboxymuconolactone decarboxylase family protein
MFLLRQPLLEFAPNTAFEPLLGPAPAARMLPEVCAYSLSALCPLPLAPCPLLSALPRMIQNLTKTSLRLHLLPLHPTAIDMSQKSYFQPEDLKKFGNITEFQEEMGKKFFDYYNEVFKEGALTVREKALIALAVAHTVQCPYCIDAYTSESLSKGADEEQMMEAVHVAAAIRAGASLVNSVMMMNQVKQVVM